MAEKKQTVKAYVPPQGVSALLGKNFFFYVNTGTDDKAGAVWTLVGGQRGGDLTRKADTIDVSHKGSGGWKATEQGLKEWELGLDLIAQAGDDGIAVLEAAYLAGQLVHVKFEYPDKSYVTGVGSITELSLKASHTDAATYSGTLSGVGPLSPLQTA